MARTALLLLTLLAACTRTVVIEPSGKRTEEIRLGGASQLPPLDHGYWLEEVYGPAVGKTTSLLYARREWGRLDISNCRVLILTERPDLVPELHDAAFVCVNGGRYATTVGGNVVSDGPDSWAGGLQPK